jgi:PAS domain S-box-containing protein
MPSRDDDVRAHPRPAFALLDRHGRVAYTNDVTRRYARAVFGKEIAVGDRMLDFATEEAREDFGARLAAAHCGKGSSIVRSLRYPNGIELFFHVCYEPLVIDGEVRYVAFSAQDLTRDQVEREKLRLYGHALDQTTTGVVICDACDRDLPVIYANAAFETITGYARDEILGRNCRFLQRGERAQPELEVVRDAIRNGGRCDVTLWNYRKDGERIRIRLALSPIRDATGRRTHFVGIQEDVTAVERSPERPERAVQLANGPRSPLVRDLDEILSRIAEQRRILSAAPEATWSRLSVVRALAEDLDRARSLVERLEGVGRDQGPACGAPTRDRRSTRLLLVDDDDAVRSIVARKLRGHGFDVVEAGTAGEALEHLGNDAVDVLVTDVRLPDADLDLPVVVAHRRGREEAPVVIATGDVRALPESLAGERHIAVLAKPYVFEDLLAAIDRLLRS